MKPLTRADRLRAVLAQLESLRELVQDLIAESDRLPKQRRKTIVQPTQEPTQEQIDAARRGLRRSGVAA